MRITKMLVAVPLTVTLFLLFMFLSPALFLHHTEPLWLLHLHAWLLPTGDSVTVLLTGKLITKQASDDQLIDPFMAIMLGCMGSFVLLVAIDLRVRAVVGTFGAARYARRRDARVYRARRAPRFPRVFLRLPVLAFWTSVSLAQATVQRTRSQGNVSVRPSRFVIGTYLGRQIALSEQQQEEHILLTAPTGSGKSSLEVIPNLLREEGSRSLFIADLKNELYRITAGAIAQHHQIWWFNPARPSISHSYNPLAYVRDAMDASMLAKAWVSNTGESSDPFWSLCAEYLITAIVLHLRATEPDAAFSRVHDILMQESFEALRDELIHSPSPEAQRKTKSFLNYLKTNERLMGSVMVDILSRFQLFDSDDVRQVTAVNEIDFRAMVDDPIALYLSIPRSEVGLYRPLLACFTMQMFRAWEQRASSSPGGTLPRGIGCYMDEFANMGYIPQFDAFISTARYLHVSLFMAIQNFAQLDDRYSKEIAETIRANANTHLVLPGAGLRECQYYSERLGETTVRTWTRTRRNASLLWDDSTWTEGETGRRLLTPEEIRTLPSNTVLMVPSAREALRVKATPYYQDRTLKRLANLPYQVTRVHPEPPKNQGTPPKEKKPYTRVVDADTHRKEDEQKHFSVD